MCFVCQLFLSIREFDPSNASVCGLLSVSSFHHVFDMLLFVHLERSFVRVRSKVSKYFFDDTPVKTAKQTMLNTSVPVCILHSHRMITIIIKIKKFCATSYLHVCETSS